MARNVRDLYELVFFGWLESSHFGLKLSVSLFQLHNFCFLREQDSIKMCCHIQYSRNDFLLPNSLSEVAAFGPLSVRLRELGSTTQIIKYLLIEVLWSTGDWKPFWWSPFSLVAFDLQMGDESSFYSEEGNTSFHANLNYQYWWAVWLKYKKHFFYFTTNN